MGRVHLLTDCWCHEVPQQERAQAIADTTAAVEYFEQHPDAWKYALAIDLHLKQRLRAALGEFL